MKTHSVMILAAMMLLPALSFAQNYRVSAPAAPPHYNQYANRPVAPAGYMQEAPINMAPAPMAHAPMPQMQYNNVAPQSNFQGGYCDGGGCDSSYGGGSYFDGGCYDSCDVGGCCADACCSTSCTYFSIFGGYTEMDDQTSTGYQRNLNIAYNEGFGIGGAIGRRVGRNLRTELEYTFRMQTPEVVQFNGNFPGNVRGQQNTHAGMFNVVYDLVFGNGNLVPYLGGGIGVAGIDSRVRYGNGVASLDGDDTSIAYQWMVGLTYRFRPNMEFFTEYRFFEIDDPKLNRFGGPAIGAGANNMPNPNILLTSEYASQDIYAGFRFNF